jgi:hypothetical protein
MYRPALLVLPHDRLQHIRFYYIVSTTFWPPSDLTSSAMRTSRRTLAQYAVLVVNRHVKRNTRSVRLPILPTTPNPRRSKGLQPHCNYVTCRFRSISRIVTNTLLLSRSSNGTGPWGAMSLLGPMQCVLSTPVRFLAP